MLHRTRWLAVLNTLVFSVLAVDPAMGQTIHEDLRVFADDGGSNQNLGNSIGVSGTTMIVGANHRGVAYLFDTVTGQQLFKLDAFDDTSSDWFGYSVAIDGTLAIVGAPWTDDAGDRSGSAYLFDTTTGEQLFKFVSPNAAIAEQFGNSVALSGTTVIIGTPHDYSVNDQGGAAYLFDAVTGNLLRQFTASDAEAGDEFGESVAISGTTAVVSARFNNATYIFDTTTGQELFKVNLPSSKVAVSGTTAIIGTHGGEVAYLVDTTTGQQLFELSASDTEARLFGRSVAISGTIAMVGASTNNFEAGSAYLFDTISGEQLTRLTASDGELNDRFGLSVAISGTTAAAGATMDDGLSVRSGSAYLFIDFCPGDLNGDGMLNFIDVSAFLAAYASGDPVADFSSDGMFNFFDVSSFLIAFGRGCP